MAARNDPLHLVLIALSACGPTDDTDEPLDAEALQQNCEAYYAFYESCRGSGDGDPQAVCSEYVGYIEPYGPDCVDAQAEVYACLSALECSGLELPPYQTCNAAFTEAHAQCPEWFPYCDVGMGSGDPFCSRGAFECLDGKVYDVECDGSSCTCTIDGSTVGSFTAAESCNDPTLGELANTHCGFPRGVPF